MHCLLTGEKVLSGGSGEVEAAVGGADERGRGVKDWLLLECLAGEQRTWADHILFAGPRCLSPALGIKRSAAFYKRLHKYPHVVVVTK